MYNLLKIFFVSFIPIHLYTNTTNPYNMKIEEHNNITSSTTNTTCDIISNNINTTHCNSNCNSNVTNFLPVDFHKYWIHNFFINSFKMKSHFVKNNNKILLYSTIKTKGKHKKPYYVYFNISTQNYEINNQRFLCYKDVLAEMWKI